MHFFDVELHAALGQLVLHGFIRWQERRQPAHFTHQSRAFAFLNAEEAQLRIHPRTFAAALLAGSQRRAAVRVMTHNSNPPNSRTRSGRGSPPRSFRSRSVGATFFERSLRTRRPPSLPPAVPPQLDLPSAQRRGGFPSPRRQTCRGV